MKYRVPWDHHFMQAAHHAATRSTCLRRQVGCVIVKDNWLLASGYNGAVSGAIHCIDKGCKRQRLNIPSGERTELCEAVHAEANSIGYLGFERTKGTTIYITQQPCIACQKLIVQARISRVVIWEEKGITQECYRFLKHATKGVIHVETAPCPPLSVPIFVPPPYTGSKEWK